MTSAGFEPCSAVAAVRADFSAAKDIRAGSPELIRLETAPVAADPAGITIPLETPAALAEQKKPDLKASGLPDNETKPAERGLLDQIPAINNHARKAISAQDPVAGGAELKKIFGENYTGRRGGIQAYAPEVKNFSAHGSAAALKPASKDDFHAVEPVIGSTAPVGKTAKRVKTAAVALGTAGALAVSIALMPHVTYEVGNIVGNALGLVYPLPLIHRMFLKEKAEPLTGMAKVRIAAGAAASSLLGLISAPLAGAPLWGIQNISQLILMGLPLVVAAKASGASDSKEKSKPGSDIPALIPLMYVWAMGSLALWNASTLFMIHQDNPDWAADPTFKEKRVYLLQNLLSAGMSAITYQTLKKNPLFTPGWFERMKTRSGKLASDPAVRKTAAVLAGTVAAAAVIFTAAERLMPMAIHPWVGPEGVRELTKTIQYAATGLYLSIFVPDTYKLIKSRAGSILEKARNRGGNQQAGSSALIFESPMDPGGGCSVGGYTKHCGANA